MDFELIQRRNRKDQTFNAPFCRALTELRVPPQAPARIPLWNRLIRSPLCPRSALWLARKDGEVAGIVGANMASSGLGYFGFLELQWTRDEAPQIGRQLLSAAETWLRAKGARKVLGPICLKTWFPYRVRTDADPRFFEWEPAGNSAVARLIREAGYSQEAGYHTLGVGSLRNAVAGWDGHLRRAEEEGYCFERLTSAEMTARHLRELHGLTHAAFRGSYLFEPIGFILFRAVYLPVLKDSSLEACLHFARTRGGKAVAFLLTLRSADALVFKTTAVLPEAQGKKLSFALIAYAAHQSAALPRPPSAAIFALVREDNTSRAYTKKVEESCSDLWWHRYSLFGKTI